MQLVALARALHGRGDEVGILTILPSQAFVGELVTMGIPVAECKLRPGLRAASALCDGFRVLREWKPDAIVSFLFQADMLARLAGTLTGAPVIVSSIRNERFGGWARDRVTRITDPLCSLTTTNSERAADALVNRGVVPRHRLAVVPNGVDVGAFCSSPAQRERARHDLGASIDDFLWVAAGRLEPQKDYPTLLRAVSWCAARRGDVQVRIAGQGPLRADLEALTASLAISDRARFVGLRADMPDVLAAADGVVMSSAWEGLPNIVLEAMAAGCPVVAPRVGGVPELVAEDVTGKIVPPRRPELLGQAMVDIMSMSADARRAMGRRARRVVEDRYSMEAVMSQWLALIDDQVARRGRPRGTRSPMLAGASGTRHRYGR